jgi:hypothetical protein
LILTNYSLCLHLGKWVLIEWRRFDLAMLKHRLGKVGCDSQQCSICSLLNQSCSLYAAQLISHSDRKLLRATDPLLGGKGHLLRIWPLLLGRAGSRDTTRLLSRTAWLLLNDRCCIIVHCIDQSIFKALSVTDSIKQSLASTPLIPPSFSLPLYLLPFYPLMIHFILRNHNAPRRRTTPPAV